MVEFRKAGRFWSTVLNWFGFAGITMPWAIYLLPDWFNDDRLRRHELKHVEQMKRDGMLAWWIKAAWYLLRYGYMNSPYEIEARAAQYAD